MFSQRFLFDTQGFVILRGVLSGPELAAARAAFERTLATATVPPPGGTRDPTTGPARSNIDGTPIREPDLERLVRQFHQQSNKISSGFRLELDVPRSTLPWELIEILCLSFSLGHPPQAATGPRRARKRVRKTQHAPSDFQRSI